MAKQFLSLKSVAEFFDASRSTVSRWVEAGVLPKPIKIGGVDRWDVDSLMRAAAGAMSEKAGARQAESQADEALEAWRRERAHNQTSAR